MKNIFSNDFTGAGLTMVIRSHPNTIVPHFFKFVNSFQGDRENSFLKAFWTGTLLRVFSRKNRRCRFGNRRKTVRRNSVPPSIWVLNRIKRYKNEIK